ncbi:hypothetical protein EDD11_003132 [Mortierella claussenii]|nr:hypothetical protein EDD11_003132 [Mortierella claussenii]
MAPAKVYFMMALGMALQVVNGAQVSANNSDTCTTPQCVLTAASIMRDMNPQVDPCQDFSAYTCGGFYEREEIPADQESIGYFRIVHDQNSRVIRSIVSEESTKVLKASSTDKFAERNIKKLKDLYSSCMDEEQIARVGRQPVVDEIQILLNLFPVSGDATTATPIDKKAFSTTLAHFNKMGLDSLSSFGVSADNKDPKRRVLVLSEGGLGLPSKEYYVDERITDIYEKTVGAMFNLLLGDEATTTPIGNAESFASTAKLEVPTEWLEVAKDIVRFEKQLAEASTNVNDLHNSEKTYNPLSMEQITAMTPSIDWNLMLQSILPANTSVPHPIIVSSPPFQANLQTLLDRTSARTLQNYLVWSLIRQLAGSLSHHYRQPLREMNSALSGVSAAVIPERWKQCVLVVNQQLGEIAGQYFIEVSFKGNSRTQVHNMIENLRETYIKVLPNLGWLDGPTTEGAIKKMKAIVQLIGFSTDSPNVASSESLEHYYKGYVVDPKDYFSNQMRARLWGTAKSFKGLGHPVNMLKMHMAPQTVNAYYSPTQNQVVFPAGILQAPFFHAENPEYVNYGGIGFVAGHEITHGFDDRGHLFDAEGRMQNWWSNATLEAFNSKAGCFVEQYSNFTVKGNDDKDYHINGQLTLGENIADNGGLKQSFESWKARYQADPSGRKYKNFRLPGLENLTPEQLFFISFARPWCNKQRPESAIRLMRTDSHSPAQWRINGAVQNSVAFAEAFQCAAGSPMNPDKKCSLW